MRQLPAEIASLLIISLLLTACAGTPRAKQPRREVSKPAAVGTYPGLEDALTGAGIDPLGPLLDAAKFRSRAPALDTRSLPWFKGLAGEAMFGPRFGADLVRSLDRAVIGGRPVSAALDALLGLALLPAAGGDAAAPGEVMAAPEIPASVPAELRDALAPILVALARVKEADAGTPRMIRAARDLAAAVEQARLARFAGLKVNAWWHAPGLGKVILSGPGDDTHSHPAPKTLGASVALLLDTGGDDRYLMPAGANTAGESAASLNIDLGGDDRYEAAGSGQGSGRRGVGLLWDLGGGADRYHVSAGGQGSGNQGIGVLLDDGGDDTYRGERGVQGAGMDGIGLLIDLTGNDRYDTFNRSQGFGGPGGIGGLLDMAGDDTYRADPGDPAQGGTLRFPSPQLPRSGNASLCQGVGAGERDDRGGHHRTGGVGLLRDRSGDDSYTAGVFAQGSAYWFGAGLLFDDLGKDQYDALWYGQGAAAHFALAVLREGGGDDKYNQRLKPASSSLGLGHDLAAGWHIDLGGDDAYRAPALSLGTSSSEGAGIMFNNGGRDEYVGPSPGAGDGASWGEERGVGVDVQ